MSDTATLHDARAVANEVLSYGRHNGRQFTVMQVIKLVYLVQGWALALLDRPVVRQTVQAWQYGPVYPQIYKALAGNGSAPVRGLISDKATGLPYIDSFSEEETDLIRAVVDNYGGMHAFQLSDLMHQPGTPWTEIFENQGPYSDIPNELIRRHFKDLDAARVPA